MSKDGQSWHGLLAGAVGFPAAATALEAGKAVDPSSVKVLPPFQAASKILCIGLNSVDRAEEGGMTVPDCPTMFARFNFGFVGHGLALVPALAR